MNDRGQYGSQAMPTWQVAIIAGGVGMALHALWGVASKQRVVYSWSADQPQRSR